MEEEPGRRQKRGRRMRRAEFRPLDSQLMIKAPNVASSSGDAFVIKAFDIRDGLSSLSAGSVAHEMEVQELHRQNSAERTGVPFWSEFSSSTGLFVAARKTGSHWRGPRTNNDGMHAGGELRRTMIPRLRY